MNRTKWYELNSIIDRLTKFNENEHWSDVDDVIGDLLALRTEIADEVLYTEFKKEFPNRFGGDYESNIR